MTCLPLPLFFDLFFFPLNMLRFLQLYPFFCFSSTFKWLTFFCFFFAVSLITIF